MMSKFKLGNQNLTQLSLTHKKKIMYNIHGRIYYKKLKVYIIKPALYIN